MAQPKQSEEVEAPIQGPAVIGPDHVQTRTISTRAGSKVAWQRLAIYEKAFRLGHLANPEIVPRKVWAAMFGENNRFLGCGGLPEYVKTEVTKAFARRDAAKAFDEGWIVCNASWPSGMDMNRIGVVGTPGGFCDHQRDSKAFWERVRLAMGINDWMICRRVMGEGCTIAQTVTAITGHRDETLVRYREALDALIVGMGRARRK